MKKQLQLLFRLVFFISFPSIAQTTFNLDTLVQSNANFEFQINSLSDFKNNRYLKADFHPFFGQYFKNVYSAYIPATELLDTLTFSNPTLTPIHDFYFFLNDNKTSNLDSLAAQIFEGCITEKEKALAVYYYVREHHMYSFANDKADPIRENYDASKFLNVYGNGNCGMIANTASQLSHIYSGNNQRHWFVNGGVHGISELKFDSTYIYVDADEGGLYYLPDNTTLGTFYDVYLDSHHYLRTKHFGNATRYVAWWYVDFNATIRNGNHYINNTDTTLNINTPCCPKLNGLRGKNITHRLKPLSSITFIPNDTMFVNHYVHTTPAPSINTVLLNIGKGIQKTDYSPLQSSISPNLVSFQNLKVGADSAYTLDSAGVKTTFILSEECPYVMSNGHLSFSYKLTNPGDSIQLFFSRDSLNWSRINFDGLYSPNYIDTTLELLNYLEPNDKVACYQYYIKVDFIPTILNSNIGLKNLNLISLFQYNKLTGPKLISGGNKLQLFSNNSQNINVSLRWKENHTNHPPNNNINPIFPTNGLTVDSAQFTFQWSVPSDQDNDTIMDYHIQVSDRPDMRFPVNTLYDRYLKLTNNGMPFFRPELGDLLNHDTTYYWHVRAQDAKGIWGDWSPTYSFKIKTPMYPRGLKWKIIADTIQDAVELVWEQNPKGETPQFYKVYSGIAELGFNANDSKLIYSTISPNYIAHIPSSDPRLRVRAVGNFNTHSPSSYFINLPIKRSIPLGTSFSYIDTFANQLNYKNQPFPPVNTEGRPIFYCIDTSKISISNNILTCINPGLAIVDICTKINSDTVRLLSIMLNITDPNNPSTYNKPTLIIKAIDTFSVYGSTINTASVKYIGFLNGHSSAILDTLPSIISSATAQSNVGNYTIMPYQAASSIYTILYQPGIYAITQKPLQVRAKDTILHYGDTAAILHFDCVGLVNNDNNSTAFTTPPILSSNYSPLSMVGNYPINISGGHAPNYSISYINGSIQVLMKELITKPLDVSNVYGSLPTSNGFDYQGFANGETDTVIQIQPTILFETDSTSHVGIYQTHSSGGQAQNYQLIHIPGQQLITKANLYINIHDTSSTYGNPPTPPSVELLGFKNDDTEDSLTMKPTIQLGADSLSSCGQYNISATMIDSNYSPIVNNGILTIQKAMLDLHIDDTTTSYGSIPNSYNYTISGFKNGDTYADIDFAPVLVSSASPSSPVADYSIYATGFSDNNYYLNVDTATLSIQKKELQITAPNTTSIYGSQPVPPQAIFDGFVNNDNPSLFINPPETKIEATNLSHPGNYRIYFADTNHSLQNYHCKYNEGIHQINKKELFIKANDTSIDYKNEIKNFNYSISGLVNNDDLSEFNPKLELFTDYNPGNPIGDYRIYFNNSSDPKYNLNYTEGLLGVKPTLPNIELIEVKNSGDYFNYIVNISESGGELLETGVEVSTDTLGSSNTLAYSNLTNHEFPYNFSYTDSFKSSIVNKTMFIRAYATNSRGKTYTHFKTLYNYRKDFFQLHQNEAGKNIEVIVGDSYLDGKIEIQTLDGKTILQEKIYKNKQFLGQYKLATGIYLANILTKNNTQKQTKKIFLFD